MIYFIARKDIVIVRTFALSKPNYRLVNLNLKIV